MYNTATALVRSGYGAVIAATAMVRSIVDQSGSTWVPPEPDPHDDGRPRAQITHRGVPLHQKQRERAA